MKDDKILDITKDIKWIGVLDQTLITFDVVMETKHGSTYNSYFIDADKKAIIETVKENYFDTFFNKVNKVVSPEKVDFIILNHSEPDHSGALRHLLKISPNAIVVGSGNTIRYLQDIVDFKFNSKQVKDGDTLSLGNKTLKFISAPNLHWPDTMYTYVVEDKVLFTCDSFGCHFCNNLMYDDLVPDFSESFKYYFDVIIKPYSKFMLKAIEKIKDLELNTVCTGHGPILRTKWKELIEQTKILSEEYINITNDKNRNVLIAYVSAYGYTHEIANALAEGIKKVDNNIEVVLADVEHMSIGEIDALLTKANAIIVGSPTLNQNIMLPIYKIFSMINPIRENGKLAMSFGSYGWSGEAVKIIDAALKSLKLNVIKDGLAIKFKPFNNIRNSIVEQGELFAKNLIKEPINI